MPLADWWTEGVASGWGGSRHMRGLWNEKADSFAKAGAVGGWSRHKITEGGLRAHWKHMQARASGNGCYGAAKVTKLTMVIITSSG